MIAPTLPSPGHVGGRVQSFVQDRVQDRVQDVVQGLERSPNDPCTHPPYKPYGFIWGNGIQGVDAFNARRPDLDAQTPSSLTLARALRIEEAVLAMSLRLVHVPRRCADGSMSDVSRESSAGAIHGSSPAAPVTGNSDRDRALVVRVFQGGYGDGCGDVGELAQAADE